MANKMALLLLGGIVLTAVGTGAAIGLYLSGGGGGDTTPTSAPAGDGGSAAESTTTAGNGTAANATTNGTAANATATGDGDGGTGPTATTTPSPTVAPTAAPTAAATATPTPEPLPRTPTPAPTDSPTATPATATPAPTATPTPRPVSPDEFNETRIEQLVVEQINARRGDRGLEKLFVRNGMPEMARNHSRRMSEQGYISHAAGGLNTEDRYRRNGFYRGCKIVDDTETDTRSGAAIETVDKVSAGQRFDGQYNRNEREVAEDAVSNWFEDDNERRKLLYENAGSLGVGVHVSGSGHAYVTVNLCS